MAISPKLHLNRSCDFLKTHFQNDARVCDVLAKKVSSTGSNNEWKTAPWGGRLVQSTTGNRIYGRKAADKPRVKVKKPRSHSARTVRKRRVKYINKFKARVKTDDFQYVVKYDRVCAEKKGGLQIAKNTAALDNAKNCPTKHEADWSHSLVAIVFRMRYKRQIYADIDAHPNNIDMLMSKRTAATGTERVIEELRRTSFILSWPQHQSTKSAWS